MKKHLKGLLSPLGLKFRGFFLLELSFALSIVGLLGIAFLATLKASRNVEYNRMTQEHENQVMHALASYVLKYKRLPCPLDAEKKEKICFGKLHGDGLVPFAALGLSENIAKDGRGQWLRYWVNPQLCTPNIQHLKTNEETISPQNVFCEIETLFFPKETGIKEETIAVALSTKNNSFPLTCTRNQLMAYYAKAPCMKRF